MKITEEALKELGFDLKVDFDKDFKEDVNYSLKIHTWKKTIKNWLQIHVTDGFKFISEPDTYIFQSRTIEIVQSAEYTEINLTELEDLKQLINLLSK